MTSILITGTNRGIGLELAKLSLEKGWTVYGSARTDVTDGAAQICGHENFHELQFDVTDYARVREVAATIDAPIDVVINNAGIIGPSRQSTLDMDFEGFEQTLAINTVAPLNVAQAFIPHLKRSERPRLITISSAMGSMAGSAFDRIAYRASKAAVNKVVQGLANDLEAEGIAAISMHPGWVQTDMGGPAADITPQESAAGILAVADRLTLGGTGSFVNYDGTQLAW